MRTLIYIILSTALLGCSASKHIVEYAGKDFVHTSSMCLDALLVNMDNSLCLTPSIEDIAGHGMVVKCASSYSTLPSLWNTGEFLVIPTYKTDMYEGIPVCTDFNYSVLYIEPEENENAQ